MLSMLKKHLTRGKKDWWKTAKIYEVYIDKFAGNLSGMTAHIDYFNKLGVDTIHILPHYPSPMDDDGYDVTDFRGVREELGTVDDLRTFFRTARKNGIRVIVDLVLNHVSIEHPWFKEAHASRNDPKRDYFLWSETGDELEGSVNPFIDFKSSNWIPNSDTNDFYFSTFKPTQADLNWDNPKVLAEILDIIDYLVDAGASGFRLDAVAHLVKREHTDSKGLPETHAILRQIRAHLDKHHPNVILLGEVCDRIGSSKAYFGNDDECHLVYNFPLAAEMLFALRIGDSRNLEQLHLAAMNIPPHSAWANFLRNHDEINLSTLDSDRRRNLVGLLDPEHQFPFKNGDDTSQRLMSILGENEHAVREAFRLLYTQKSATIMYYGDEIGMKNTPLPQGTDDSRLAVRGMFDWEEARRQMADPDSLWHATAQMIKDAPLASSLVHLNK